MIKEVLKERINYIYKNKKIEFLALMTIGLIVR